MTKRLSHLARLALVLGALTVGVAAVGAPPAAAKAKCWQQLLNDWYDGRIDKTYAAKCYTEALKHLPTDVEVYSDARTQIERALASAMRKAKAQHKSVDDLVVPPSGTRNDGNDGNGGNGTSTNADGPVGDVLGTGADSADGVPLPLLILGGLALLLVAGGVAGVLVRRIQARRPAQ